MTLEQYREKHGYLSEIGQRVTERYEYAARLFDQLKEILLIQYGLKHTSDMFHATAHWFPGQFDVVGDILHQCHVMQIYGATAQVVFTGNTANDVFFEAVAMLDKIADDLTGAIQECDEKKDSALARQFETLLIGVSEEKDKYMAAWKMLEETDSASSFDNWVAHTEEGGD